MIVTRIYNLRNCDLFWLRNSSVQFRDSVLFADTQWTRFYIYKFMWFWGKGILSFNTAILNAKIIEVKILEKNNPCVRGILKTCIHVIIALMLQYLRVLNPKIAGMFQKLRVSGRYMSRYLTRMPMVDRYLPLSRPSMRSTYTAFISLSAPTRVISELRCGRPRTATACTFTWALLSRLNRRLLTGVFVLRVHVCVYQRECVRVCGSRSFCWCVCCACACDCACAWFGD